MFGWLLLFFNSVQFFWCFCCCYWGFLIFSVQSKGSVHQVDIWKCDVSLECFNYTSSCLEWKLHFWVLILLSNMEMITSCVFYKDFNAYILHGQCKGQMQSFYAVRNNKADLSMLLFHLSQTRILISLIRVQVRNCFSWYFFLANFRTISSFISQISHLVLKQSNQIIINLSNLTWD